MNRSGFIAGALILSVLVISHVLGGAAFAAQAGKKIATVSIPATPEQYATDPQPLTAAQCAQCHSGLYRDLKNSGGRHRFSCQNCHISFHAYSPRKGNWDAIMPKCSSCHDAVHGPKISDCSACHSNPHSPRTVTATAQLVNACFDCHGSVRDQLVALPSKHTKVACMTCHTSHGLKPSCFNCHKPHTVGQTVSACLQCHPAHQPLKITLAKDTPASTCASCHGKVYEKLTKSVSKHKSVACVDCHKDRHKFIPQCSDCHGLPHKKVFHDQFPRCLSCHIDVHDLPVMSTQSKK